MDATPARTAARSIAPLLLPLLLLLVACGSPPPTADSADPQAADHQAGQPGQPGQPDQPGTSTPPEQPGQQSGSMRFRFRMQSPDNDDFAFRDDDIYIYIRPFEDNLSFRIEGRRENFVRIQWDSSEFVDVLGRRYKLVPPEIDFSQAAYGIPFTDIATGQRYVGRVHILDTTALTTIQQLGGKPFPIVPPDAGTAEQLRGRLFELHLDLELNSQPRRYDFIFEIRDAYDR